ncbi:hypothetical protein [Candidatus Hodgkinia cicadicola]|uniref:hypothetical protein n=1 Tax=Candidatus Hodgkinia cicadicola TaxID=573658 RepID=UPI001788CEDF
MIGSVEVEVVSFCCCSLIVLLVGYCGSVSIRCCWMVRRWEVGYGVWGVLVVGGI